MMALQEETQNVWAVVDEAGRVVLLCSGGDAPTFLEEWTSRGYRAVECDEAAVHAA